MKKWRFLAEMSIYAVLIAVFLACASSPSEPLMPSVTTVVAAEPVAEPIEITITIPAPARLRAIAAFEHIYPIPQIPDPDWVDPKDGSTAPMVGEYTSEKWIEIRTRQWLRDTIARAEQARKRRKAKFAPDTSVVPEAKRVRDIRKPIR